MGKDSKIGWTHHTFNPWWGCQKVSPGCANCYAEGLSKRAGFSIWGNEETTTRRFFGAKHWAEPFKWNDVAVEAGERRRVFCASMADVGEDRADLVEHRRALSMLIEETPSLDWLLLTKRPENMVRLFARWNGAGGWPSNVWVGTSVENQEQADKRVPHLLKIPAAIRFLSCEPLLGPVDLTSIPFGDGSSTDRLNSLSGMVWREDEDLMSEESHIDWLIVGGESGRHARPMDITWAEDLHEQAVVHGTKFFMKQLGGVHDKRADMELFPETLRVRQYPG